MDSSFFTKKKKKGSFGNALIEQVIPPQSPFSFTFWFTCRLCVCKSYFRDSSGINLSWENKVRWDLALEHFTGERYVLRSSSMRHDISNLDYYLFLFATKKYIIIVICQQISSPKYVQTKGLTPFLICWIEYTVSV